MNRFYVVFSHDCETIKKNTFPYNLEINKLVGTQVLIFQLNKRNNDLDITSTFSSSSSEESLLAPEPIIDWQFGYFNNKNYITRRYVVHHFTFKNNHKFHYFGLQNNSQQNWKLDIVEPPFDIEGHKITGLTPKLYF